MVVERLDPCVVAIEHGRFPHRTAQPVTRTPISFVLFAALAACAGKPEASQQAPTDRTAPAVAAPASSSAAGTAAGGTAAPATDADCNLATVLKPGIPGSPGHLIQSARNPNGDSELAVLMRRFVDDLQTVRPMLEAGEKVAPLFPVHRTMRCVWPTKPEERNQQYDLRAQAYLAAVSAFDQAPGKDTYNAMIAGCIACHSVSCGGPLEFIGEMRWQ